MAVWKGNSFEVGSQRWLDRGKPLCNEQYPFKGFIYGILGDLDYFIKDFGMPHNNCNEFCFRCCADRSATRRLWLNFSDIGQPGHWTTLLRDGPTRVATNHPIFRLIPGVSHRTLCLDVLHMLDLGISQHIIGNILYELVFERIGGDPKYTFARICERMHELYEEHGTKTRITSHGLRAIPPAPGKPKTHQRCCNTPSRPRPVAPRALPAMGNDLASVGQCTFSIQRA